MDFESILEEILLGRGQEPLNLSRKRKTRYNGRDCLIVGATAESLKRLSINECYFLHTISCKV